MEHLQELYAQIGTYLRDIAPPKSIAMSYIGFLYPTHEQGGARWVDENQVENRFGNELPNPARTEMAIQDLVRKLKGLEPFASSEPFTHFQIKLTHEMKFSIDFEYIPEEQSWARVYMKPVGALTAAEAKELFVPEEHWLVRKKLYDGDITKPEFDAEIERLDAEFEAQKAARGGALR